MKIIFEMDEKWRKIKGWPYKISNYGRVKRSKRGISTHSGKILKFSVDGSGYRHVFLYNNNRKRKKFNIHKLVAHYFIGLCPEWHEINHIDGNKENNKLWNLEYVTRSENAKHAYRLGLRDNKGENHPSNKLREEGILEIRRLYKSGSFTQKRIGQMFNVSKFTVSDIIRNKTWKHVV